MINGNSLILCQPNTRTFEFIKALIKLRIVNCADLEIIDGLTDILIDKDLDENSIFTELNAIFETIDIKDEIISLLLKQLVLLKLNYYQKLKIKQIHLILINLRISKIYKKI